MGAVYCIHEYPPSSAPCANEAKDLFCRGSTRHFSIGGQAGERCIHSPDGQITLLQVRFTIRGRWFINPAES